MSFPKQIHTELSSLCRKIPQTLSDKGGEIVVPALNWPSQRYLLQLNDAETDVELFLTSESQRKLGILSQSLSLQMNYPTYINEEEANVSSHGKLVLENNFCSIQLNDHY